MIKRFLSDQEHLIIKNVSDGRKIPNNRDGFQGLGAFPIMQYVPNHQE